MIDARRTDVDWYAIENVDEVLSPSLVVYPDRVRQNIRRMIDRAGGVERLRPHVKTHKMAEVVELQRQAGITKFKCSTVAEAELLARCGVSDVLLGYAPVGPNLDRVARLAETFRGASFSVLADDEHMVRALSDRMARTRSTIEVLLDVDNGMHRSGVAPGERAIELYKMLATLAGLKPGGLHVYDGHIRDGDVQARIDHVRRDFEPVDALAGELRKRSLAVPRIVAGGTPTFPAHALRSDVECSPGTCVFWDYNYATKFPDLDFQWAAVLVTRVVSRPAADRLCLDLGYKAVSPDSPGTRVHLLDVPDAEPLIHNEEHLAIRTASAERYAVGDVLYGIPAHVCPTVALHARAYVAENNRVGAQWPVAARDRVLTI